MSVFHQMQHLMSYMEYIYREMDSVFFWLLALSADRIHPLPLSLLFPVKAVNVLLCVLCLQPHGQSRLLCQALNTSGKGRWRQESQDEVGDRRGVMGRQHEPR